MKNALICFRFLLVAVFHAEAVVEDEHWYQSNVWTSSFGILDDFSFQYICHFASGVSEAWNASFSSTRSSGLLRSTAR